MPSMKLSVVCECLAIVYLSINAVYAETRTWTLANGEFLEAELVTFSGTQDSDSIRIRTGRGDQNVLLRHFSKEDKQFVRDTIIQFQQSHGRAPGTASLFSKRTHYKYSGQNISSSPVFEFIDHDGRTAVMPIPANSTVAEITTEQLEQSRPIAPYKDKEMYNAIRSGRYSVSVKEWRRMTNIQKRQKHRQHEVWKLAEYKRNELAHAQRMAQIPADVKQRAEEEEAETRLLQLRAHEEEAERAAREADAARNQADIDWHRMQNAANEASRAKWQADNTRIAQDPSDMRAQQAESVRENAERIWRESESRRQQAEQDLQRINNAQ